MVGYLGGHVTSGGPASGSVAIDLLWTDSLVGGLSTLM